MSLGLQKEVLGYSYKDQEKDRGCQKTLLVKKHPGAQCFK